MRKISNTWKSLVHRHEFVALISSVCVLLLLLIATKGTWFSDVQLATTLKTTAFLGIIAVGQALLIIGGEFDLSVGSVYAFVGLIYVWLIGGLTGIGKLIPFGFGLGLLLSFVIAMLVGVGIGLLHAFFVTRLRMPSLIVTLGSLFIFRGVAYIVGKGWGLPLPRAVQDHAFTKILGGASLQRFNISIAWVAIITVIFAIVLSYTRYGNHLQAVGKDPVSALSQGVSPAKTKLVAFVICSVLASFASILNGADVGFLYATSGRGYELESIAAAVLGGCTIGGGSGSIWGAVVGVFLLSLVRTGLIMLGAPVYWYITFVGVTLIAVTFFSGKLKEM